MNDDFLPPLPPPSSESISNDRNSDHKTTISNGPFGLSMGLRIEDLEISMIEVKPCIYKAETLPKKHSAFQYYILQITPAQGLSWVKSIGNTIATNPYGHDLQSSFEEMKKKLEKIYGPPELIDFLMYDSIWNEPRDWMQSIQNGERRLAAKWDNSKGKQLPSDLRSIFLYVAADDTYSGYIAIEYEFRNYDASETEISMLEDDAL